MDPQIRSGRALVRRILAQLRPLYSQDPIEVDYRTPFQLVVAVILSAQCTDKRVNAVTRTFFDRLKTPEDYLALPPGDLEELVKPTGFFRNKAKNILGAARKILADFGGEIPASLADLVTLPGFGRKTANVILSELHGRHEGIVVDTHVLRLAKRLELSAATAAEKVERDLLALTPEKSRGEIAHFLILHGRRVCFARHPECARCALKDFCPSARTPQ